MSAALAWALAAAFVLNLAAVATALIIALVTDRKDRE